MTNDNRPPAMAWRDDDGIGSLVRLAGRRPMPDPAATERARAAARAEWARVVARPSWPLSRWKLTAAVAAAGIIGAAVWFGGRHSLPPRVEVATLEVISGGVLVTSPESMRRVTVQPGERLRVGDRIEAAGRVAFSLGRGISVRLDRGTSAVLDAPNRVTLDRGALYVDAGSEPQDGPLRVETVFGSVSHVGTRFEVRIAEGLLRVSVREGRVAVERAGERWLSHGGERLLLAPNRPPERQAIQPYGPEWHWTQSVAPVFQLEGATVPSFLHWASHELGVRWEYEDPATTARVVRIVLHGSIEGLTPEDAIAAVLPTCSLTYSRSGGRLIVSEAR